MPYLYCAKHGKEYESRTAGREEFYRREGETILIMRGKLISGPWRCDQCYVVLPKRRIACLVRAFSSWFRGGMEIYDFSYERGFFDTEQVEAKVYGAEWPGGQSHML